MDELIAQVNDGEPTHHARLATGWIEVIAGSMFSGKSEELIRRLRRAKIARQKVQVFQARSRFALLERSHRFAFRDATCIGKQPQRR